MKTLKTLGALCALTCFLSCSLVSAAQPVSDVRSIDGTNNNLSNTDWGAAETALPRLTEAYYPGDGSGATFYGGPGSSAPLPNPRQVSNKLYNTRGKNLHSKRGLSNMLWQWGQFLDHDITLVHTSSSPIDFAPIMTSPSDAMAPMIPFQRSGYASGTGTGALNPRQQVNSITSYIDASNVYGSDSVRAAALRDTGNGGRLKMSVGDLLPYNTPGLPNAEGPDPTHFLAGDIRANEQVGLTAMHTLFVREHNRLADRLADENPSWSDEELYQTSRKIVGAEMQAITYQEFLPALLGRRNTRSLAPHKYAYDDAIDPSVSNEFATAIYRFGHSMLPEEIKLARVRGAKADTIALKDAFFNPAFIESDATDGTKHIEQLLLGMSTSVAQEVDAKVVDGVRNFLFGDPGSGGLDLAALNIQRSRDHGLPTYNEMRSEYGLYPANSWRDITDDRKVRRKLRQLYDSPDDLDAWVGALVEDHIWGSSLGELAYTAILDQFTKLRDGDRYFYAGDAELMNNAAIQSVIDLNDISLSDIMEWNTSLRYVPNDVFRVGRGGFGRVFDGIDDIFGNIDDLFGHCGNTPSFPGGNGNYGGGLHIFSVPEPASCLLASLGCTLALLRRRTLYSL